jgi:large-conductance mechanosensitive channel
MLRRFFDLVAETWILDLAAGIALGIATLDFVRSIFSAVIQFWTQKEPEGDSSFPDLFSDGLGSLAFEVDGRPVYLAPIVESGLTLLTVAGLVFLILRALTAHENAA